MLVLPTVANAATGQFGKTTPGGAFGCPGADFKYGNKHTLSENGSVTKITAWMRGAGVAGSQLFRTMIYAADAAGGAPGTLLATSQTVTVDGNAAEGPVEFPFGSPVPLAAGDYWLVQQSGPASATACLSQTTGGTNPFNADSFADGPSNPYGSPLGVEDKLYTLAASYETAADQPDLEGAAEAIDDLLEAIDSFDLDRMKALERKAARLSRQLDKGRIEKLCKNLDKLEDKLAKDAEKKKPKLSESQRSELLAIVGRIETALGC
jgi:hypothetical protein